nr:heparan N-sulfatase [Xanthomonadales bacterium]NIQ94395.1 heparan N-sulfatase [Desulfuromonadales bacterium]NIX11872.1 heparan N-sulfatase [Xanthomonadales bacterium]
ECLHDLARDPDHADLFANYRERLTATLEDTGDPRALGHGQVWEDHPRLRGQMRYFPEAD